MKKIKVISITILIDCFDVENIQLVNFVFLLSFEICLFNSTK